MRVNIEELIDLTNQGVLQWKRSLFGRTFKTVDFDLNLKITYRGSMYPILYRSGKKVLDADKLLLNIALDRLWDAIEANLANNLSHPEDLNEKISYIKKALKELD